MVDCDKKIAEVVKDMSEYRQKVQLPDFIPDEEVSTEVIIGAIDYLDNALVPTKGRKIMDESGIVRDIPDGED